MDRTFVAQQQRTPVFTLGLELWRNHVVRNKQIEQRLQVVLLDLVKRERSGETVDRALFRSITQVGGWVARLHNCMHAHVYTHTHRHTHTHTHTKTHTM